MNILINDVMDQKKISIYKMAKDTDIPYSTLRDVLSGKTDIKNVSFEIGMKIAEYLQLNPQKLLEEKNNEVIYTYCFKKKYFGKIIQKKKKYFVKFNDLENCERVEYVGNVSDNVKPFVYDFALWTMQRFIDAELLEKWEEFV